MSVTVRLFWILSLLTGSLYAREWESALYPRKNDRYERVRVGHFQLPDFSFAGYRAGEREPPRPEVTQRVGPLVDEQADATAYLQAAIDRASGGVLLILPGTYRVTGELVIPSRTIVRGSGTVDDPTPTRIIMEKRADTVGQSILTAHRSPTTTPQFEHWGEGNEARTLLAAEVAAGASQVMLPARESWTVGEWVVVGNRITDSLRREYNGTTEVWHGDNGFRYLRRIVAVGETSLTLDHPIPHLLQTRDHAFVVRTNEMAEEIGIEDLSLGFRTPDDALPWRMGKGGSGRNASYHNARAITLGNVINSWVRNVRTFSPDGDGLHLHSRGITVMASRWVTLTDCYMGPSAHRGGAGNGYLYSIDSSNHVLVRNSVGQGGRHNFLFGSFSSECVVSGGASRDGLLTNDMHGSFNHAILIEDMTIGGGDYPMGDAWQAMNRGGASNAVGYTAGDVVFWNLRIDDGKEGSHHKTVHSAQAAVNGTRGYVIGATRVRSGEESGTATEWREGIGAEAGLRPQSLHASMRAERLRLYPEPANPSN